MAKNNGGGGGNRGGGGGNNSGGGSKASSGGGGGGSKASSGGGAKAPAAPVFQTNAGVNPMGAPAKNTSQTATGNSTNQAIQKQLASAGAGVNYMEASAIAQNLGVSVDRVYNQTAKTGQNAVAGGAAANAGYVPTSQLKVSSPITVGYVQQASANAQAQVDAANAAASPASGNNTQAPVVPEFDWNAWNAQMMAQQAAIWESMDAMNTEFMRKQEDWFAQRDTLAGSQGNRSTIMTGGVPADKAAVKRKKRTTSTASATGLNTSSTGATLSLGGAPAGGGLSIGKA